MHRIPLIGLDGLDVVGHRGDDAEGREDPVGHDEGDLAGLEVGLELGGEVLGVAVAEHEDGLEGGVDGVLDAEMGGLVDEDGVDLVPESLDEEEIVEIAGNEMEGILRPEVLGDPLLQLDDDRVVAESGPGRGAVDAELAVGGDPGVDDLGIALQGEIARAAEVDAALPVDDGLRARGALHDEHAPVLGGGGRRKLEIFREQMTEGGVHQEQGRGGLLQEQPPPGLLRRDPGMMVRGTHRETSLGPMIWGISSSGKLRGAGNPVLAVAAALMRNYYRTGDWRKSTVLLRANVPRELYVRFRVLINSFL